MDSDSPFEPHRSADGSGESETSLPAMEVENGEPVVARVVDTPRWWTTLAVCAVSLLVFMLSSVVMTLVAIVVVHGNLSMDVLRSPELLTSLSDSRLGLTIMVVAPQIGLVLPALVAAYLSPVRMRRRLSLVRGHWPIWAWFAAAFATPLVGLASGALLGQFVDDSETLQQMTEIFRDHGKSGFLLPLAIMIGATPAVCEELLFRGYIQTRLNRTFGPMVGITSASILFAAFHLDPVHVAAVFPLGLFMGWVAWRSGSIFPAMMGHFVNNAISVFAVVLSPEEQPDVLDAPTIALTLSMLGAGMIGLAGVAAATVIYGKPAAKSLDLAEQNLAAQNSISQVASAPNPRGLV